MYNNAHTLSWLSERLDDQAESSSPIKRNRLEHEPCLPARLPSTGESFWRNVALMFSLGL
jgi:hypothetical protein